MPHIDAKDVVSPKNTWMCVEVIVDEGPGRVAYAIGTWDGERRVGMRWNGTDANPLGNPQSRGLPTWTMLDDKLHPAIVAMTPPEKQGLVSSYLNLPAPIELVVDFHAGSKRRTLKERQVGTRMYRDLDGALFANDDSASFYEAAMLEVTSRQEGGQHVTFKDSSRSLDN